MIKQHTSFNEVPDNTILWQYMSLTKFLYLVKFSKLHFHRIDCFMDKEEDVLSKLVKASLPFFQNTEEWNKYLEEDRKRVFVSCWTMYPIEQSVMWEAYGKNGVAIKTTAGDVRKALKCAKEDIYMIQVNYIDKENIIAQVPGKPINWIRYSTTKRTFFEMENEVRLLFFDNERIFEGEGVDLCVNLKALIKDIKVSSSIPDFVYQLICKVVKEANIEIEPIKSELYELSPFKKETNAQP